MLLLLLGAVQVCYVLDPTTQQGRVIIVALANIGAVQVRYVLDPTTQQGLMQQEVSLLSAASMVVTSAAERRCCGSMLRLYELSHAVVPGGL